MNILGKVLKRLIILPFHVQLFISLTQIHQK